MSRVVYQAGMRAIQVIKDQASTFKSFKDSSAYGSSAKQARKFSCAIESTELINTDKLKQAEESLRTVMYLSCWGPN